MSRLIDADKLMSQVVKKKPEVAKARYTEGFNDAILKVRSMIHSAATYEAIEVVRCKDCRFYDGLKCNNYRWVVPEDGYCHNGERSKNEK